MTEKEIDQVLERINSWPRLAFLHLPTPLEFLTNLTEIYKGPEIYVKRDDLTGRGFGGNKSRKLEFIIADALKKGCDSLVTWGSYQSNWCFQLALASRRFNLKPILILFYPDKEPENEGNLLLNRLLEAEIYFSQVPAGKVVSRDFALDKIKEILPELTARNLHPYIVSVGGSMPLGSMEIPLGAVSYLLAFYEAWRQAKNRGISFSYVIHASGSGATQVGLLLGTKIFSPKTKVIGISVSDDKAYLAQEVKIIAEASIQALSLKIVIEDEDIIILDDYLEGGYGIFSPKVTQVIKLLLQKEGLVLDPVYTAKAMIGLLDLIRRGFFEKNDKILFFHTGGAPALFAYGSQILSQ
ncbi:MAG: D-cysteine desulfhydrase family protein [Candidatus Aminicenantes bacterium]|nr:D-cysteine desulfhydrase family protein [Candidatus Aminicenantes bacterium]